MFDYSLYIYDRRGSPLREFVEIFHAIIRFFSPAIGLVQKFLSARFWIPLSRLTYSVYLIHLIVLPVIFIGTKGLIHYDFVNVVSKTEFRNPTFRFAIDICAMQYMWLQGRAQHCELDSVFK